MRSYKYVVVSLCFAIAMVVFLVVPADGEFRTSWTETVTETQVIVVQRPVLIGVPTEVPSVTENESFDDIRVREVYYGMQGLTTTEYPRTLERYMVRWGEDPNYGWDIAAMIVRYSDEYGVDPFDILAMAWHESRFNPSVQGDCNKYGTCVSCGIIQINTRFKNGRPSCTQAKQPSIAFRWAAKQLSSLRDPEQDNRLVLYKYNGGPKYEVKVRRTAELARWHSWGRMKFRDFYLDFMENPSISKALVFLPQEKNKKKAQKKRYYVPVHL